MIVTDEERWKAVINRNRDYDNKFVYGVTSTKIYCRPSCASRQPRRERVRFFEGPNKAEAGGFRACRRCQPDQADAQQTLLRQVCEYIEAQADQGESLTLTALGRQLNISPSHLQKLFKQGLGISPKQYLETYRLDRLKQRLKDGDTVTQAMYEVGYGSSSRLYEQASARLGMTPATYRQGGKGMTIKYVVVDSPLGKLLLAATERGLCAASLGNTEEELLGGLKREYPQATLEADATSLQGWAAELVAYLSGRPLSTDLPLAVAGTPFQERVWQELKNIPYGATRSYGEVARAIGQPTAVRAVARACATNKVALVIPCHRVVREDGSLGGYRWGLERKQTLLDQEKQAVPA